jgi:hypothetical protein
MMNVECRMMNDEVPSPPQRARCWIQMRRDVGGVGWGPLHSTFLHSKFYIPSSGTIGTESKDVAAAGSASAI